MHLDSFRRRRFCPLCTLCPLLAISLAVGLSQSISGQVLDETNYDQLVPAGKEVDAIYGDIALTNAAAKAIIANPIASRHANMTVRDVGGGLIDLAHTAFESDQLSAFYPGRRQFRFSKYDYEPGRVTVICPGTDAKPECRVQYEIDPKLPVVSITTTWTNTTDADWQPSLQDDLRVDAGREVIRKSPNDTHQLFYFTDLFWQQAYGIRAPEYRIHSKSNQRESVLTYEPQNGETPTIEPGESYSFRRDMIVARDLVQVRAIVAKISGETDLASCQLKVVDADGNPVPEARVELNRGEQLHGIVTLDKQGSTTMQLPAGRYSVSASIAGISLLKEDPVIEIQNGSNPIRFTASGYRPGRLEATITDGDGRAIPAKVEFEGHDRTPTPNWGPESGEFFVRNLAYTDDGSFEIPMQSGEYDVIVSHGPEYDAVFTRVHIEPGKTFALDASLNRSVQTPGWISSDFHSHSSPSGDNTGSQLGRVLNLAAEHIEFAPCTEHNRISTYEDHIERLGLTSELGTVSGIELTGQPLLLNHQNVFPLNRSPRTQDGGGPLTDVNPETQIQRVTMWDERSEKLVQQNHPDFGWLFFDRDGDGTPDRGYWRSFRLMDVVEIHPIDRILRLGPFEKEEGQPTGNQKMFNWLQLLNQGMRIYGVVNTDAHYNYHGSGWLRNWIQVSTDEPSQVDPMEIVHAAEQGRLIMSNGPYLEATFDSKNNGEPVVSGQELEARDGTVSIDVRVQCPNWFDVDTVFVLVNGRAVDELTFTRDDHPEMFSDEVVKFDHTLECQLEEDSHLIVVTGHRSRRLGDVMGPVGGFQYPAALTNPVFVDIDGNGFVPNRDTLGHPLPVKFGAER